jgi:hypothetical protein
MRVLPRPISNQNGATYETVLVNVAAAPNVSPLPTPRNLNLHSIIVWSRLNLHRLIIETCSCSKIEISEDSDPLFEIKEY